MHVQPASAEVRDRAWSRVRWSHRLLAATFSFQGAFLAAGLVYAAQHGRFAEDSGNIGVPLIAMIGLGEVLLSSYIVWASFWGVPVVWRLWRRLGEASAAFPVLRWLRSSLPLSIPAYIALYSAVLGVGMFYGAVGGAFYEYATQRRLASVRSGDSTEGTPVE